MRKALKRFGWIIPFCIIFIAGWFTKKILLPAFAATPATVPVWKVQVTPWRGSQQIAFTQDGKQVLDSFFNFKNQTYGIRRWDVASGKELPSIKTEASSTKLSKNGMFYMTTIYMTDAGIDKVSRKIRIYRVSDQKQIGEIVVSSTPREIVDIIGTDPIIVFQDLQSVTIKNKRATKRSYSFWDVSKKKFLHLKPRQTTLYDPFAWSRHDVAFSDNGMKAFSMWPAFTLVYKGRTSQFVEGLQPRPDFTTEKPKETWLLNEVNGKVVKLPFFKTTPGVQFIWKNPALSKDETLFAATSTGYTGVWTYNGEDGSIRCYDLPHRKLLWTYYKYKAFPGKLVFSPDGTMLVNAGRDADYRFISGYLNILDTKTGKVVHGYTEQTLWGQISDRTRKFVTDKAYNISFLKRRFGKSMERYYNDPPPGNSGYPRSLAWSPDNKMLAAAYADGSLKLWRVQK